MSFFCTYVEAADLLMLYQVYPSIDNVKERCASDASFAQTWETLPGLVVRMDELLYTDAKEGGIHSMSLLVTTPEPVQTLDELFLAGYVVLLASKDGALIYNVAEQ